MYPCTVFNVPSRNLAFIVDGENWIPVALNTTLEDAKRIHRDMFPGAYLPKPKSSIVRPMFKSHTFKSTRNVGAEYEVRVFSNGRVDCSCPGFKFRNRCKHADHIRKSK